MSQPEANASQLLAAARVTAGEKANLWGPSWSRAAAFLARQALEAAIGQLWVGELATLSTCSFFDQLLCLPTYLSDEDLARRARHTWCALSQACHAHPYELAPTLGELEDIIGSVSELLVQVGLVTTGGPSPQSEAF